MTAAERTLKWFNDYVKMNRVSPSVDEMKCQLQMALEEEMSSQEYINGCSRVEVIDRTGRAYVNTHCKSVQLSRQDEGKTLKVFIS